jgi:hypothetical protein
VPDSIDIILKHYLERPESKSLAPDGTTCGPGTKGLLRQASIVASEIIPVGKETDRHWEQGEDMSLLDFKVLEYRPNGNMLVADLALRNEIKERGIRKTMRDTGMSQHTIEAICADKEIRRSTLQRLVRIIQMEE